jgi:hypothetical protein
MTVACPTSKRLAWTNVGWGRGIVLFLCILMQQYRLRFVDLYIVGRLIGLFVEVDHCGFSWTRVDSHLLGSLLRLRGQWSCCISIAVVSGINLL